MELKDSLEQSEHIAHAAHGHDEGGHGDPKQRLGTYIGITMAVLGVLLAFCAAKVGGERTELVQALVEQSNAHAQYHAQDVKHRVAVIALEQLHATAFGTAPDTLNKSDVLAMADTVDRYLKESNLAKDWSSSFDPAVLAHVHAQESYESAQLGSEVGIVLASVALLMRRKALWIVAIVLGVISIGIVARTYVQTTAVVKVAEEKIEETAKVYNETRAKDKTTDSETQLLSSIRAWAGAANTPAAAAHSAARKIPKP
ncbi:MAG TPA: DUF4337 family protein [Thermoanaerobaculia bacterium]|jgi:hypothetical protein|nr:DUF4337 family protein [Thermoanaerobaculia bacterium]